MRTLLPHRNLTASIVNKHGRQTIQLNDEVVVNHPDLIAMDGVVHKIDRVLLPPRLAKEESNEKLAGSSVDSFLAWFWPWSRHDSKIEVMELMERIQPCLID